MKNITKLLFFAVFGIYSLTALANGRCVDAYKSEDGGLSVPFISTSSLRPQNTKALEEEISDLRSNVSGRSWKRESLERDAAGNGNVSYMDKTQAIKDAENALRGEKNKLEEEERGLVRTKVLLIEALEQLSSPKKKSLLEEILERDEDHGFMEIVSRRIKNFGNGSKEWTQEDADRFQKNIAVWEANAPIRKQRIANLEMKIETLLVPLRAKLVDSAKRELSELEGRNKRDNDRIAELEARILTIKEGLKMEAQRIFAKALEDSRLVTPVTDLAGFYSLERIPKSNKVTLLIGGPSDGTSKLNSTTVAQISSMVKALASRKYYVLFDATSVYAPLIAGLAGPYGIPVAGKLTPAIKSHRQSVVISNDYLRMQALSSSKVVLSDTESVSGIGLFSENLVTHVLDVKNSFQRGHLDSWVKDLDDKDRNLGISNRRVEVIKEVKSLFNTDLDAQYDLYNLHPNISGFKPFVKISPEISTPEIVERIVDEAISFAQVMQMNSGTGGSVIFGSGKEDAHSANLVYQTAFALGRKGIAVATGGADGAMKIANTGAFNAGGPSIGIPVGGKNSLDTEKTVATQVHTKTIPTRGYEERIPALLGEGADARKLIIFAPGGNGTIRELAVTLVRAAGKPEQVKWIVFLDKEYYGGLVEWIKGSDLPDSVKAKVVIFDKVEEVKTLADQVQEQFEKDRVGPVRKDQPTYEVKRWDSNHDSDSKKDWRYNRGAFEFGSGDAGGGRGFVNPSIANPKGKSGTSSYTTSYSSSGSNESPSNKGSAETKKPKKRKKNKYKQEQYLGGNVGTSISRTSDQQAKFSSPDEEVRFYNEAYGDGYN